MALVRKYFVHGLILSLLLGGVFTFLGVYDTNAQPMFKRYIFWTSTMVVGCLATGLCAPTVWFRVLPHQHRFVHLTLIAAIISFPVTLVLAAYDHNYGSDWGFYIWWIQYRYVIVISLILVFGGYFVLKAQGRIDVITTEQAVTGDDVIPVTMAFKESAESRFLKRLPAKYQSAKLYAVSAEDHYLRIHTSVGEELILLRFTDALRELEHVRGMQTHRSWWVANSAVVERTKLQGKTKLLLTSGLLVPVSRTFEKQIKDAEFS